MYLDQLTRTYHPPERSYTNEQEERLLPFRATQYLLNRPAGTFVLFCRGEVLKRNVRLSLASDAGSSLLRHLGGLLCGLALGLGRGRLLGLLYRLGAALSVLGDPGREKTKHGLTYCD